LKAMPFAFNPSEYRTNKLHFFKIPTSVSIVQCYYKKYHIFFTSKHLQTSSTRSNTPPPTSAPIPMNISSKKINKSKEVIPESLYKDYTTILPPFPNNYKSSKSNLNSTLVIQGFPAHIACIPLLKLKHLPQSNPFTQEQ
ncbi:1859_t:CDS:2, partial [Gigaspora margarita]